MPTDVPTHAYTVSLVRQLPGEPPDTLTINVRAANAQDAVSQAQARLAQEKEQVAARLGMTAEEMNALLNAPNLHADAINNDKLLEDFAEITQRTGHVYDPAPFFNAKILISR